VAALRFPLRSGVVASVVAGMGTAEEVRSNVEWLEAVVPAAAWKELDNPAPGP
jgi:D-threo-aldose 1-dehydrogenase